MSRAKSFFFSRGEDTERKEENEPLHFLPGTLGDSFVLKGNSGTATRGRVQRSKSMDVLRARVLRRGGRREDVALDKGGLPSRDKKEYVRDWSKQQSFYSLYFPGEEPPTLRINPLVEEGVDDEGDYVPMDCNSNTILGGDWGKSNSYQGASLRSELY